MRSLLQSVGILRESGHEHFNGSLVVPIFSEEGEQVLEMYGRKVTRDTKLRKGTPLHLYLPGKHKGVWNIKALQSSKEIILCEALIDAMTYWVNGYRNVTASYGTQGFTEDHLAAFKRHGVKRVLIAYDKDSAGEAGAKKVASLLMGNGIECFRIRIPGDNDVNSYATGLIIDKPQDALGNTIRKAEWLGKGTGPKVTVPVVVESPSSSAKAGDPIKQEAAKKESAAETTQTKEETPAPSASPDRHPCEGRDPIKSEPQTATPTPEAPKTIEAEVKSHEINITLGDRSYRVRGLYRNHTPETMKVNLLVKRDEYFHIDSFDMYCAKQRYTYIKQAASELAVQDDTLKKDLGKVLLKLELLQEEHHQAEKAREPESVSIEEEDKQAALALLKDSNLLSRIVKDFDNIGVVGEDSNKLVGYLAATSRKLDTPLAVMIQSSSAAGKSSLMDAVLKLMPEEERIQYSAMTGQSLFYMGEQDLKHKILAIAEEEGASQASYALKLLQSEGEVNIASTGKDAATGQMKTTEYRVEGPVMLFMTTTAIDIDEELLNRCLVLTVNEDREQTKQIHDKQRFNQTIEGLLQKQANNEIVKLHRNAQRLLRPLMVANPYAQQLTFLSDKTRSRRDHMKYLTLIKTVALLRQYQKEIKAVNHNGERLEYIEVEPCDIEVANNLAHEVLGRTLDDLPPQTRKLLDIIYKWVTQRCTELEADCEDFRFSRKDIRQVSDWGETQLRLHMGRLVDMEYVLPHRGSKGQSYVYELVYKGEGESKGRFALGLNLPQASRGNMVTSRPQRGEIAGGSHSVKILGKAVITSLKDKTSLFVPKMNKHANINARRHSGKQIAAAA